MKPGFDNWFHYDTNYTNQTKKDCTIFPRFTTEIFLFYLCLQTDNHCSSRLVNKLAYMSLETG